LVKKLHFDHRTLIWKIVWFGLVYGV
jgi:hypothetical protein